jgi:hypothetical protein
MSNTTKGAVDQAFDNWLADPSYEMLQNECAAEIYSRQATTLESAKNWDEVMFNRGWCSALAFIRNLRDIRLNEEAANEEGI